MAYSLKTNKDIIKWCDSKHLKNQEVSLHWEGGNDSGWCWIEVDGKQVSSDKGIPSKLVNLMYEYLDYGSWAGEFSAQGEAKYDPEKKAFVGTDYYGEETSQEVNTNIIVRIPSSVWFDTVTISADERDVDSPIVVHVEFRMRNGFLTYAHDQVIEKLREELPKYFERAIEDGRLEIENEQVDVTGLYFFETYRRDQFRLVKEGDKDMLEYVIDSVSLSVTRNDPKDVYLVLQEDEEESSTDHSLELNHDSND